MTLQAEIINIAKKAKEASFVLGTLPTKQKDKTLFLIAKNLLKEKDYIIHENKKDLAAAEKSKLSSAFIDRLSLNEKRIKAMADSVKELIKLKDPVGQIIAKWRRPNGMVIEKVRVPIGVIGIIYESRPNVTSDCIGLCLRSSNAVILRGGSEAINSNTAIFNIANMVVLQNKIPSGAINFIAVKDRKAVDIMLGLNNYIDLIIPRGGKELIKLVTEKSKIPLIKHYEGICHIYVDKYADLAVAEKVCFNAKVQRPATCNAMETLLVHREIANKFLPGFAKLLQNSGVEIRGCPETLKIVKGIKPATALDWRTEYLDLILSIKIVRNLAEAINHINFYGSRHSDGIITRNKKSAEEFSKKVDSAAVFVNVSTRLHDGYEFGLGAEMGISTDKIHCRGPMGLEELTIYKYIVTGKGQIRK